MSYSCDKLNNSISKNSQSKQKERKYSNAFTFRRYSPNNNKINNMTLIPNQETSSSGITNISIIKEKEKPLDFQYFSFPIKPLEENNIENFFIKKNKKLFESPQDINNKKITFQRQKDKKILEFFLFDDKTIFKDINKAYLQDEKVDDGDESSDEKIKLGQALLFQELDESSKDLKENLKYNKGNELLSRKLRFKNKSNK
jgi:hypothetical protein